MIEMSDYKQLDAWKQSIQLVDCVYDMCKLLPSDERFGIVPQMQRCAVLIPANLAEGCGRDSTKEFSDMLLSLVDPSPNFQPF